MFGLCYPNDIMDNKLKEKEAVLLHIIEWAQKHNIRVENLTFADVYEAVHCKF
jgi:hypothetical protein